MSETTADLAAYARLLPPPHELRRRLERLALLDLTLLRVLDHESVMNCYDEGETWPGLLDGLPDGLRPYLTDERLNLDPSVPVLTLALWCESGTSAWRHGRLEPRGGVDPEITSWLLDLVEEWDLDDVYGALSYDHGDASGGRALHPSVDLGVVAEGASRIGRPLAAAGSAD